jgi:nucleolar pre-ribosomal-associated protein 1
VLPQVALSASFDVAPFLETALRRLSKHELDDPRDFGLILKELENLLAIAGFSPGMNWFAAPEGLSLSPFTLLLKVCVDAPHGVGLDAIRQVLNSVAVEQRLVPTDGKHPGLLVLLEALQDLRQTSPDSLALLWPFLDNCLTRCANAPAKYAEEKQETSQIPAGPSASFVSPLLAAISEQLPFVAAKAEEKATIKALGRFLPTLLGLCATAGESRTLLNAMFSTMVTHLADSKGKLAKAGIPEGLQFQHNPWPPAPASGSRPGRVENSQVDRSGSKTEPAMNAEALENVLHVADHLDVDNSALVKWSSKTVDELVDEGYLASLISLLVSEHASIRKEALVNVLKAAAKFQQSEYEEKEQVWLLLSELAETARDCINDGPLPSPIVAFACHALNVLRDPLSNLYPRVNTFLTRGPVWSLDKLPLVDELLSEEPDVGDAYYSQTSWLLGYLLDGLRTPRDLQLFHKQRAKGPVFQRVLALAANPFMRLPLRTQVLRLLYRATRIEGASTTLTTRFDVAGWLEGRQGSCADAGEAALYGGLRRRIWETCDRDRLRALSRRGLDEGCNITVG